MKNFGKLKGAVNCILADSALNESSKDKDKVKKYLKGIKKSDLLKTEYIVYSNLEEAHIPDKVSAIEYVKENLSFLDGFEPKKVISEHAKFAKNLNSELKSNVYKYMENYSDEKTKNLHENISELVHLKKTPSNLNKRRELIENVAEYIMNNEQKEINESRLIKDKKLPNKVLAKFALNNFNKKYANLNESEKKAIKAVLNNDDEQKTESFKEIKYECLEQVNNLLKEEEDLEIKEKLLKTKEKLLSMKYTNENYVNEISKVITLKNDLN